MAMSLSVVALLVLFARLLLHALAVLLDLALGAARLLRFRDGVRRGPVDRVDLRRCGGLGARAVALVRGFAGDGGRDELEAAFAAGVVDLHRRAVFVLRRQGVAGE